VINGETTLEEAVDLLKRDTRHFARRQLIWFRADPRIQWMEMDEMTTEDAADKISFSIATAGAT
jgi:tRNA dimethylallyltransferase